MSYQDNNKPYVRETRTTDRSGGSMALIVGGLVVAVGFILWLVFAGPMPVATTTDPAAPAEPTNVTVEPAAPAEPTDVIIDGAEPAAPAEDVAPAPAEDVAPAPADPAAPADGTATPPANP